MHECCQQDGPSIHLPLTSEAKFSVTYDRESWKMYARPYQPHPSLSALSLEYFFGIASAVTLLDYSSEKFHNFKDIYSFVRVQFPARSKEDEQQRMILK